MDFIQAKHYLPLKSRGIDIMVLHAMQVPEKPRMARGVAGYFRHGTRRVSAHYNIDDTEVVQSVHDKDVAYAAPGANSRGLQFEMAGYSEQNADEWLDSYSTATIMRTSALVRNKCEQYRVPKVFLSPSDLLRPHPRGITTHVNVSSAFGLSTHWDPGPFFPVDMFMRNVIFTPGDDMEVDFIPGAARNVPGHGYWSNGRRPFLVPRTDGTVWAMNNLPGHNLFYKGDCVHNADGTPRKDRIESGLVVGFDVLTNHKGEYVGYEFYAEDGGTFTFK